MAVAVIQADIPNSLSKNFNIPTKSIKKFEPGIVQYSHSFMEMYANKCRSIQMVTHFYI